MKARKTFFLTIGFFVVTLLSAFGQTVAAKNKFDLKERYISSFGLAGIVKDGYNGKENLYGINFSPSINLLNRFSDFSVSLAATATASYHPQSETDDSKYFLLTAPAFVDVNFGHLSSHDFYSDYGFFIGAGYGAALAKGNLISGLAATGGLRTWLLKKSFTLRYTLMLFDNGGETIHELSLQLNVGAYLQKVKSNNKISKFMTPYRK